LIHPDDLALLEIGLQTVYPPDTKQSIAATIRIKSKDPDHYCLFHCSKTILETFDDGRLKKVFVIASEIKEITPSVIQVLPSLSENVKKKRMMLLYHFTPREQQVLHLIAKGHTNNEIAEKLIISITTARKHRNNLILKSKVKNTAALVALAVESGGYSYLE
jgi:DNA-binding NarL/FixJ family response regulator